MAPNNGTIKQSNDRSLPKRSSNCSCINFLLTLCYATQAFFFRNNLPVGLRKQKTAWKLRQEKF